MATNFPASIDSLTNPTSSDTLDSPDHAGQHADANDAIEALQAKVGADSSAVTTSHDYKIAQLEGKSPTITLAGDASGSVTLTNLGSGTLTLTVANDSHTHDSRYFTETESDGRYLGISAKAADSDLLDGINSSSFLRSDVNDSHTATLATSVVTVSNEIQGANGSSADPTYTFTSSGDTGMWSAGTGILSFSGGGGERARFGNNYCNFYGESRFYYNTSSNDWSAQPIQAIGATYDIGIAIRSLDSDSHTTQLRPAGNYLYVRNHNDSSGIIMRAASYENYSTIREKQDVVDWGATPSVGAAVDPAYAVDATEMVRNFRPVKFRRIKGHALPADLKSERKEKALTRLNDYRNRRGLKPFYNDDTTHFCGRDCDGSETEPCKLYRNWEQGELGFIAEEVIGVNPDAVRTDDQDSPISIDLMAMIATCVKSLQEIDSRITALETS